MVVVVAEVHHIRWFHVCTISYTVTQETSSLFVKPFTVPFKTQPFLLSCIPLQMPNVRLHLRVPSLKSYLNLHINIDRHMTILRLKVNCEFCISPDLWQLLQGLHLC